MLDDLNLEQHLAIWNESRSERYLHSYTLEDVDLCQKQEVQDRAKLDELDLPGSPPFVGDIWRSLDIQQTGNGKSELLDVMKYESWYMLKHQRDAER